MKEKDWKLFKQIKDKAIDEFCKRSFEEFRQMLLMIHAAVTNVFNLGRHLVSAGHYKSLRKSAFSEWSRAAA